MKSENISDIFTQEGIAKLSKGQILTFDNEGRRIQLKITRIDRKNGKIWAKRCTTYNAAEIVVTDEAGNIHGKRGRVTIAEHLLG